MKKLEEKVYEILGEPSDILNFENASGKQKAVDNYKKAAQKIKEFKAQEDFND